MVSSARKTNTVSLPLFHCYLWYWPGEQWKRSEDTDGILPSFTRCHSPPHILGLDPGRPRSTLFTVSRYKEVNHKSTKLISDDIFLGAVDTFLIQLLPHNFRYSPPPLVGNAHRDWKLCFIQDRRISIWDGADHILPNCYKSLISQIDCRDQNKSIKHGGAVL